MPFDLRDPRFRQDPYPFYAELRQHSPVVPIHRRILGEVFFVARYADVSRVLKEDALFTNDRRSVNRPDPWWTPELLRVFQNNMVGYDGADHRRLRNLVHKAFTPGRIEALSQRIGAIVDGLLDEMEARGEVDLISQFALPLPLTVISEMMGLTANEQHTFQRGMAGLLDLDGGSIAHLLQAVPKASMLMRFFRRLIERRRGEQGDDIISALIAAEEGGDRLSEEELLNMVFLLLLAGHETTVNLVGTGILALLEHPEQLERLRSTPELIDTAIEELLRFTNPVQMPAGRYTTADVELSGTVIPRGSMVMPILASANRDETVFANADQLDIGRTPNKHFGLGYGVHYCLGAPLARLEARHAFVRLLERFPEIELSVAREKLRWRKSISLRGLEALPLRLRGAETRVRRVGT